MLYIVQFIIMGSLPSIFESQKQLNNITPAIFYAEPKEYTADDVKAIDKFYEIARPTLDFCALIQKIYTESVCILNLIEFAEKAKERDDKKNYGRFTDLCAKDLKDFDLKSIDTMILQIKPMTKMTANDCRFIEISQKISTLSEIDILRKFIVKTLRCMEFYHIFIITPELLEETKESRTLINKIKKTHDEIYEAIRVMTTNPTPIRIRLC